MKSFTHQKRKHKRECGQNRLVKRPAERRETFEQMLEYISNPNGYFIMPEQELNSADKLKKDVRRLLDYDTQRFPMLMQELLNTYNAAEHQAVQSIIEEIKEGRLRSHIENAFRKVLREPF